MRRALGVAGRTFASAMLTFLAGYYLRTRGADGFRGYDPAPIS